MGAHVQYVHYEKTLADEYCVWLFNILFQLEKEIDLSKLPAFDARLFGRVSELLLDVWIEKHHYAYKEIKMIQLGNENWPQKIKYFLAAKFLGKNTLRADNYKSLQPNNILKLYFLMQRYDYLIVGAGLFGSIFAYKAKQQGKNVW